MFGGFVMIVGFHSVKGGQGCTITTLLYGFWVASIPDMESVLLVDYSNEGDLYMALGVVFPAGSDPNKPVHVRDNISVARNLDDFDVADYDVVVYDIGQVPLDSDQDFVWPEHLLGSALVTLPCYTALRRYSVSYRSPDRKNAAVVVRLDQSRSLRPEDCVAVTGLPLGAVIKTDSTIGRKVDAGLMSCSSRLPDQNFDDLHHIFQNLL
jgi:hypothetical protein